MTMDKTPQLRENESPEALADAPAGGERPPDEPGPEGDPAAIPPDTFERESAELLEELPRGGLGEFSALAAAAVQEAQESPESPLLPRPPRTLADLGLSKAFLTDLALKILHYSGTPSVSQLTRRLGLAPNIMQQLISALSEAHLVEVLSQSDLYTGNYRYRLSERGHARVAEALERSRYAGPAPVTAEQYSEVMQRMLAQPQDPGRARIKSILNELVLSAEVADSIGRALYSGKAAIFFGASGNGKTVILERFASNLDGFFLVPYAIYAYGQVIRVFDQSVHEPIDGEERAAQMGEYPKMDTRWVAVKRPAIVLGAEMERGSLDLAYDPQSRFYQAPPHIKAQGGVLVVDDFGRQAMTASELMTRWLIPLERGWDTLTLVTGEKLTVPFRVQLLFGTNLPVKKAADDALLRRVLYKVEVPSPRADEFMEILRQTCRHKHVLVEDGALEYVVERLYSHPDITPRGSYARDLLGMLVESAAFDGREPVLARESFDRVFKLFVAQESEEVEKHRDGDGQV
ncbi:MAG: hypothetical protein Q7T33_05215 [Dehalococcoidia bacterium]|nr:hypothetical protein [Dehalococcoidia bacterium]